MQGAQQHHAPSMMYLGKMCLHGQGMPVDYDMALLWFERAAEEVWCGSKQNYRDSRGVIRLPANEQSYSILRWPGNQSGWRERPTRRLNREGNCRHLERKKKLLKSYFTTKVVQLRAMASHHQSKAKVSLIEMQKGEAGGTMEWGTRESLG